MSLSEKLYPQNWTQTSRHVSVMWGIVKGLPPSKSSSSLSTQRCISSDLMVMFNSYRTESSPVVFSGLWSSLLQASPLVSVTWDSCRKFLLVKTEVKAALSTMAFSMAFDIRSPAPSAVDPHLPKSSFCGWYLSRQSYCCPSCATSDSSPDGLWLS